MKRVLRDEWSIEDLVPPAFEPLTLSQAKSQLNIAQDQTDFDQYIVDAIAEARSDLEQSYGIRIVKQQVRIAIRGFPSSDTIRLPIWPVQSVDAVSYIDTAGNITPMTVGEVDTQPVPQIIFSRAKKPCELRLPFAKVWPTVVTQTTDALRIDLTVGFLRGDSPETLPVPGGIPRSLKFLIGHFFMNREAATVIGRPSEELVLGVERAMANIKLVY